MLDPTSLEASAAAPILQASTTSPLSLPYISPISHPYLPAPILQSLQRATELKPASYKAWHEWAMINFEVVAQNDGARYVVPAVRGKPEP